MYQLQSISGRIDPNQDDAPWQTVDLEPWINRSNLASMLRAKEDRELDSGDRYTYRIVPEEPTYDYVDHYIEAERKWVKVRTPVSARRVA